MATMKKNDPANYRRNSEPFQEIQQANEALAAFFEDVRIARDKHRIADVVVLCEIAHTLDGEEVRGSASSYLGDRGRVLPIIAREFGAAQQRHEEEIALLIAQARKSARMK